MNHVPLRVRIWPHRRHPRGSLNSEFRYLNYRQNGSFRNHFCLQRGPALLRLQPRNAYSRLESGNTGGIAQIWPLPGIEILTNVEYLLPGSSCSHAGSPTLYPPTRTREMKQISFFNRLPQLNFACPEGITTYGPFRQSSVAEGITDNGRGAHAARTCQGYAWIHAEGQTMRDHGDAYTAFYCEPKALEYPLPVCVTGYPYDLSHKTRIGEGV